MMVRACSSTTRTDRGEVGREPAPFGSGMIDRHREACLPSLFPSLHLSHAL